MQNPLLALIITFLSVTLFAIAWTQSFRPEATADLTTLAPPPIERSISSQQEATAIGRFGSAHLGIIKLGCLDPTYGSLDTNADVVRLSGRLCGKARVLVREARARHVGRNTALVGLFDPHDKLISTEFFPLDPGENVVELELVLPTGKTIKTVLRIAKRERALASKR